jgi:hypothetical protein
MEAWCAHDMRVTKFSTAVDLAQLTAPGFDWEKRSAHKRSKNPETLRLTPLTSVVRDIYRTAGYLSTIVRVREIGSNKALIMIFLFHVPNHRWLALTIVFSNKKR